MHSSTQSVEKKKRVLVAMSGGVDSSAAAILLHRSGYEVVGVTMKLWDSSALANADSTKSCCGAESARDAKYVCRKLGAPHYTINYASEFKRDVIDNLVGEYLSGRTPNPCIRCNSYLKWGELVKLADQLDIKFISTGHYARIDRLNDGEYALLKGHDEAKDQSYALWGIQRQLLSRTILPIGTMVKGEIRQLLRDEGFGFSDKPESQEICFVPDNNLPRFIKESAEKSGIAIPEGSIVNRDGTVLGKHRGIPFYTIGQRKWLGIGHTVPLYVKSFHNDRNEVVVSEKDGLLSRTCIVSRLNWLAEKPLQHYEQIFEVKIRYRHLAAPASCELRKDNSMHVAFKEPQRAITPGQSAVFYRAGRVLGGGIIDVAE